jgi:MYXO-CTERM domain-containing protein
VELFATGTDGQLYHSAWANSAWPAFSVLSAGTLIAGEPSAIVNPAGNGASEGPEVFARSQAGKVLHLWWNGTTWTDFTPHFDQTTASDPFGWIRADGAAEVFTIDDQGVLTRSYHDPQNGWVAWAAIGGTDLDPCLPATPSMPGDGGASGGSGTGGTSGAEVPVKAHGSCSCRAAGGEGGEAPLGFAAVALAGLFAARRKRTAPIDRG